MARFPVLAAFCAAALFLAVQLIGSSPSRADDAVQLQLLTQPKSGGDSGRIITIDSGDPVTIGTRLAVLVKATADTRVNIRYVPSDGSPTVLATGLNLKAGESKRLPEKEDDWYQISSGAGEEQIIAEDASGTQLAAATYRIVDSSAMQIGNLATPGSAQQQSSSAGGVDLGSYAQAPNVVAKSQAVSKALEQAPSTATSRSIGSDVFKKDANGVVLVVNGDFIGAGAILDQNGLVVTNHHVVAGADEVSVVFMPPPGVDVDGAKSYDATVERIDVVADLALIRIKNPPENMTLIQLGDPSAVEVGEEVNAIGHPHGEFWSFTRGYVSQIRPQYGWDDSHYEHKADVIQTQTPINPGNSGGPLLDDDGKLIGINSFVDPDAQGLNYAVSVDEVERVMQMTGDRLADGTMVQASDTSSSSSDIKVQTSQSTTNGSGYKTWEYVDNHDGKPDRWGVDVDGDGKPDLFLVDTDGDGKADYGLLDRNEDGKPEAKIIYGDRSKGEADVWEIDDNEDGKPDSIGMDYDYDGKPDVIRPE